MKFTGLIKFEILIDSFVGAMLTLTPALVATDQDTDGTITDTTLFRIVGGTSDLVYTLHGHTRILLNLDLLN